MESTAGKLLFERFRVRASDTFIYREMEEAANENEQYYDLLAEVIAKDKSNVTGDDILEFIRDRWISFEADLQDAQYLGDKLFIHRCVAVKNLASFSEDLSRGTYPEGYEGLGTFWTWDYGKAECYRGEESFHRVIMTGSVHIGQIDFKGTVLANFHPMYGQDEKEIRLKAGTAVRLTDLSRNDTWHLKRFDPPVMLRA